MDAVERFKNKVSSLLELQKLGFAAPFSAYEDVLLSQEDAKDLLTYITRLEQQNDERVDKMIQRYIDKQNFIVNAIINYIEESDEIPLETAMLIAERLRQKFLTENEEE